MLYLVATPIGNLGDISTRALDTLRTVDFIASEDTRHTGLLLKRFDIPRPQVSFHEHNERRAGDRLLGMLRAGQNIALVTDAGTPGISDPGYTLVRRCIDENIPVTMVPGPAAFVVALVLSGLASHAFTFRGFPPRKQGPRKRFLDADRLSPYTLIYYESPFRIADTLADALEVFGDRPAAIANDLTKMFEVMLRGHISELLNEPLVKQPKGEYVLVVGGATDGPGPSDDESSDG